MGMPDISKFTDNMLKIEQRENKKLEQTEKIIYLLDKIACELKEMNFLKNKELETR